MGNLQELVKKNARIKEMESCIRHLELDKAKLIVALQDLLICPAFNSALFLKDKESHKAWTLGRAILHEIEEAK